MQLDKDNAYSNDTGEMWYPVQMYRMGLLKGFKRRRKSMATWNLKRDLEVSTFCRAILSQSWKMKKSSARAIWH